MKTANRKAKKEKKEEKRSAFWAFMGGDFLLHKKVTQFYPYLVMLILLAAIIIANDNWIRRKEKKLERIENEYKNTVSKIKKQNEFLPYDTAEKVMQLLKEEGFTKDEKKLYKIPVQSSDINKK
ncbi:hypothetical protein LJC68_01900 [Bacteroidales bacterium OttesenSCG-928-B11]|nr:hypothetical protein [Bacteroidales bacterium OttesenSCG-928-C03]MDL2311615.1 hypothetical protein [Bacteroidales bacterium OttesenSCG-928-B11]